MSHERKAGDGRGPVRRHLDLVRKPDGLVWLWLDRAEASTNTLSSEMLGELADALAELEKNPPRGLIIASAKATGFVAGADIEEFSRIDSAAAARDLVERGWSLFGWLARLPFPTLALVRGHCMGGGLELALACRYRIVVDEPATRLALPEVMLGILPAWGGMHRLPRLVGPVVALDMMLTGKSVDARKAHRIGLADACVPPRVMENAAAMLVASGAGSGAAPASLPRRISWFNRLLNGPLKPLVASRARKQLAARASRTHYPAPYAIVETWSGYDGNALAVPSSSPASLDAIFRSPTAKNLLRVFHLQERLKGLGKPPADGRPFSPRHVHVIGAGVMGGDIAAVCAQQGLEVTLQDQDMSRIAPALARAAKYFERRFRGDRRAVRFALDRLMLDPEGHGVRRADVVIEAIFEDLDAKRALFARIEREARADAVIATNTSSLRVEDIATALARPQRLVGIHFFNPVTRMPLVEVVRGEASEPSSLQQAAEFVRRIDKLPLPVASAPGFLVNAVLAPYMLEALRCVEEGVAPATVDRALTDFGMPMGPVELVDTVGLDIALAAGKALAGERDATPPKQLVALVESGHRGRKSGKGYYEWDNGKARKPAPGEIPDGLTDRVLAPLLAAVERCVEQGVVADADLADAGVIFGTGFAPWTGGPMWWRGLAPTRENTG